MTEENALPETTRLVRTIPRPQLLQTGREDYYAFCIVLRAERGGYGRDCLEAFENSGSVRQFAGASPWHEGSLEGNRGLRSSARLQPIKHESDYGRTNIEGLESIAGPHVDALGLRYGCVSIRSGTTDYQPPGVDRDILCDRPEIQRTLPARRDCPRLRPCDGCSASGRKDHSTPRDRAAGSSNPTHKGGTSLGTLPDTQNARCHGCAQAIASV